MKLLQKITSSFVLNVTDVPASEAATLKAVSKTSSLTLAVKATPDEFVTNLKALQTLAKAKGLSGVTLTGVGSTKPQLSISAANLLANPEALALIKGSLDITVTDVAAADATKVIAAADKLLKTASATNGLSKISIKDTAANLVTNIKALETLSAGGRIDTITVSDGKALVLTEAQIKSGNHFLAEEFSSNTSIEATAVSAADVLTVQSLVNANSKLTLTKESIVDTAANIQANLDNLETEIKVGGTIPTLPVPLAQNQIYNPDNGHVYEYVAHAGISWESAKAEADAKTYAGANGYLTTITSQAELDFIENNVIPNGPSSDNTYVGGHLVSGTTSKWEWADGPEKGTVFWDNGAVAGQYANWNTNFGYPRTGAGATNEPALAINVYFQPKFSDIFGRAIQSASGGGNTGYVLEYSGFNTTSAPKINPVIAKITASDKGSITVSNSTLLNDLDALKVLTGPYTLKVTDITVAQALAIKAPSKDATLSLAITDTTTAMAGNIDKLAALVKSKSISSISLSDVTSKALTLTSTQLTANGDTLKLVQGDYKLAVTDVLTSDIATVAKATKLYSIAIKDTADNVLAGIKTIAPLVTAAKVASVALTDKTAPTLSIDEAFTLKTTLPNVTLPTGIKPIIADTASNVIAHARYDVGDVLSGAGKITLTDKTPPNLTLADAKTLKALTTLDPKTKYNVADGGNVIATQASTANDTILSGATAVYINKNFSIAQAKAVSGIKTLDKGTVYSINDTAINILNQAAVKGETVLSKANAVNVIDTSANILAKLDQLEALAKACKIADITFTDTPTGALSLTPTQLLNDAEAIGKIISQRTLPTLTITPPKEPTPFGAFTFDLNLPVGGTSPFIKELTPDGTKAWGLFYDQKSQQHVFSIKTDGTGFVDLTPPDSRNAELNSLTPDGTRIWGNFQNKNYNEQHPFITKIDGTGYIDLSPSGSSWSSILGLLPDSTKAWGYFNDQNGQQHAFITKTDGTGFIDLSPLGATQSSISGFTPDGTKAWGSFQDQNGQQHAFITKTDGTGFVDATPTGATQSSISGFTPDGTKAWGSFQDQNGQQHAFITKTDGTGFVDTTPSGAKQSWIIGFTPDGTKAWGSFQDQNNKYLAFSIKTDGTGFVNLTPLGSTSSSIYGITPDGIKAWGVYSDQNSQQHVFITKTDGIDIVDLTPKGIISLPLGSINFNNSSKIKAIYQTPDLKWHVFVTPL